VCYLAGYLLHHKRFEQARDYARIACATPMPAQGVQVDRAAHGWRARDVLSDALHALGDYEGCLAACREMLSDPSLPAEQRTRVIDNVAAVTSALANPRR
jgi:hypothetical protein